jgi:hypothetical protein
MFTKVLFKWPPWSGAVNVPRLLLDWSVVEPTCGFVMVDNVFSFVAVVLGATGWTAALFRRHVVCCRCMGHAL